MLLLVVDPEEKDILKKQDKYLKSLDVSKVLSANSIDEAKELIKNVNCPDCPVVINFLIIEQYLKENKSLEDLSLQFRGVIIIRVIDTDDELRAIDLLKNGIITEYFLADKDENTELSNLKKAFEISLGKKRFNKLTRRFEETIKEIHAVQKLITK